MFEEVMQSKENYKLDTFTVTVTDSGPQAMKEFWRFYCNTCDKNPNIVTAFFKQHQEDLGVNAKVNDLINNFDVITIPTEKSVYAGCLLPWEPNCEAGPNSHCFIREMSKNANNMHLYMKEVSKRAGLFLYLHLIFRLHLV